MIFFCGVTIIMNLDRVCRFQWLSPSCRTWEVKDGVVSFRASSTMEDELNDNDRKQINLGETELKKETYFLTRGSLQVVRVGRDHVILMLVN